MDRAQGTAFGAVVLALIGSVYLPRGDTGPKSPEETAKQVQLRVADTAHGSNVPLSQEAPILTAACRQILTRLTRFDNSVVAPSSCFPEGHPINKVPTKKKADLQLLIALVPDPLQTHLPLSFDRSIEAIQQAAQDEKYAYDHSWFPWNQMDRSYELLADQENAEKATRELQKQPGILVFRRALDEQLVDRFSSCQEDGLFRDSASPSTKCKEALDGTNPEGERLFNSYKEGLIVFVVAEQPTGGINDTQFENALQWIDALKNDSTTEGLRILGPSFSGSLPSLARELTLLNAFQRFRNGIVVESGSTSSELSMRWFQQVLARQNELAKAGGNARKQFQFRTRYESDSLIIDRFLCYLQHQGYDTSKVAILSEDETAFGSTLHRETPTASKEQVVSGCDLKNPDLLPIYLNYPRDIATLRSEYEKQSVFSAGRQRGSAPSAMLRADLREPNGSEHDTVRTYAGQLTALAQESLLFGITNIMDSKHIEFVILRSSNSLDQLFLSEFLRRSYPSGRVVVDGSDLLFRRGMEGASLRGVLLLSPYPLLSWTHDSVRKLNAASSTGQRVFALDSSEGLYIAARDLLDAKGEKSPVSLADYGPPAWAVNRDAAGKGNRDDDLRPPTWITVVGHRQFWPIAVLNSRTQVDGPDKHTSMLKPEQPTPNGAPHSNFSLPGEMVGLIACVLLLCVWHLYCCRNGSIIGLPRVRTYFAPTPQIEHATLIFIGTFLLGYLCILLGRVLANNFAILPLKSKAVVLLAILALGFLPFWAYLKNCKLPLITSSDSQNAANRVSRWRKQSVWIWPLLLLLLTLLRWYFLSARLDTSNRRPAFWRSVYLRSGVSPLLPEVLLLLGFYAWSWFSLQGLSLFRADRPVLPSKKNLPKIPVPVCCNEPRKAESAMDGFRMFSKEDAGDYIEAAARPLNASYLKSLAIFVPFSIVVFWFALGEFGLRTLGDRHFGTWIFLAVCLCIALILAEMLQFLRTWSRLHRLLIFLDRLRLRRTLAALKGISWESVWKMSGNVLEQRYRLISRQFESMRNLQNTLNAESASDQTETKTALLKCLSCCETAGRCFAKWYVELCDPKIALVTDITPIEQFQKKLAAAAGSVMTQVIQPAWSKETQSLILSTDNFGETDNNKDKGHHADGVASLKVSLPISAAEEFFVLPFLGFIQNTIGRLRSMVFSIVALFVAATFAVSSYPFDPLPVIAAIFLALFAMIGVTVVLVYAEMHRDPTLSHLTNTRPGELGFDFWMRVVTFGIGPLIGLLTTLFPSITDFLVSFIQPGTQAMK